MCAYADVTLNEAIWFYNWIDSVRLCVRACYGLFVNRNYLHTFTSIVCFNFWKYRNKNGMLLLAENQLRTDNRLRSFYRVVQRIYLKPYNCECAIDCQRRSRLEKIHAHLKFLSSFSVFNRLYWNRFSVLKNEVHCCIYRCLLCDNHLQCRSNI